MRLERCSGIIDMGVKWAANLAVMAAKWLATKIGLLVADKGLQAASLAATLPIAAAATAIWAAPATLATIATGGAAALQAPASIGVATALTKISAIPGFESGDYTGGRRGQIAGFVHGEEFVFSAPAVDAIGVDNLRSAHQAALSGATPTAVLGSGSTGAEGINVTVIQVASRREATAIKRNAEARGQVVRIIEEDFGLRSRRA